VDDRHGNVLQAYDAMGRPAWPTPAQITMLRKAGQMSAPEGITLNQGQIQVQVPQHGLVLLQIAAH
jgi:xylan 1,4-beta-xylosidase